MRFLAFVRWLVCCSVVCVCLLFVRWLVGLLFRGVCESCRGTERGAGRKEGKKNRSCGGPVVGACGVNPLTPSHSLIPPHLTYPHACGVCFQVCRGAVEEAGEGGEGPIRGAGGGGPAAVPPVSRVWLGGGWTELSGWLLWVC